MSDGDGSPSGGGGPAPAGGAPAVGLGGSSSAPPASDPGAHKPKRIDTNGSPTIEDIASLTSPRLFTPNPFSRKNTSLDIDDYFTGPRDIQKHSKWPIFLQMHGSILPKMILPLLAIGSWATALTCVSRLVSPIGINSILLTVLGFVVGLSLSFRSSTAYERYNDGRKYWSQLILATQNLGRIYWIHSIGRKEVPEEQKELIRRREVLERLTAMNLIVAFAVALKHKLRFEPYTCYEDISSLIAHLDTFAKRATEADPETAHGLRQRRSFFKSVGEYLGVSFAESNPRKKLKKATSPVGNLPLEILSYLASYTDELALSGRLPVTMHQTMAYNNLLSMNDVLVGTERVLNTPLPIAYTIAIAQITWVYILLLPFQLLSALGWLTIPATVAAAYIILGLLFIGREIENPFGQDVNDLPLEAFCAQIAADMDVLASRPPRPSTEWMESMNNHVLWPLSNSGFPVWMSRPEDKIHEAVNHKVEAAFQSKRAKDAAAEAQAHRRHLHTSEKNGNTKDSVEAV